MMPNERLSRVLVANDDGIHAYGLGILERIAKNFADEVWVVAPAAERSGASRSYSLKHPLRLENHGERRFSLDGTPADCVMFAIKEIMNDALPDLVLSGINHGSNLGEEVGYSGTVSAAIEATVAGIPAIALSQLYDRESRETPWENCEAHAEETILKLLRAGWPRDVLINVNFPPINGRDVRGTKLTHLDRGNVRGGHYSRERRIDASGVPYYWGGFRPLSHSDDRNSDVGVIEDGFIAVTPIHLDFTDRNVLKELKENMPLWA